MANSVDTSFSGFDQRTQAPVGSLTGGKGVGKLLPVPGTEAAKAQPIGLVKSEFKGSSPEELNEAIASIRDYVQDTRRSLEFRLDDSTGITVVSVFDAATKELIRQIPNEEAVSLARKLNQEEPLSLFKAQV